MAKHLPSEEHFLWPDPHSGPWHIVLHMAPVRGRLECVGVEVLAYQRPDERMPVPGGPHTVPAASEVDHATPITATALRSLPLGAFVSEAASKVVSEAASGEWPWSQVDETWRVEQVRAASATKKGRGGRRGHGAEHFAEVAGIYVKAHAAQANPTQAVAEHWTVAKTTAAKWVARARELGFLGPTTRGRAGGITREAE